jgi:molybdopterin converting factor small subunit
MRVLVSSHVRDYTGGRTELAAAGRNLMQIVNDLDRQCPGLKFRIVDEQGRLRRHVNVFINGTATRSLRRRLSAGDEIHILAALSGG